MAAPVLTEIERQSALFLKLKMHFEERLARLRAKNDGLHEQDRTNRLRGQIAEAKYFISLGDKKPTPPEEDELFTD